MTLEEIEDKLAQTDYMLYSPSAILWEKCPPDIKQEHISKIKPYAIVIMNLMLMERLISPKLIKQGRREVAQWIDEHSLPDKGYKNRLINYDNWDIKKREWGL
jgi:hypothetical protein